MFIAREVKRSKKEVKTINCKNADYTYNRGGSPRQGNNVFRKAILVHMIPIIYFMVI